MIVAVAVAGSLAIASSAAAIQVPIGSSTDAPYSGSGTPTSVYSLLNGAYAGLSQADSALVQLGDPAVPQTMPAENALTAAQAQQIAADFTNTTINGTASSGSGYQAELTNPSSPAYDPNYATQAPQVGAAGTSWSELSQLVGSLGSATGILNSSDSASVSSSATITSTTSPFAYNMTLSAPSGGYILPSAFSLTFPSGLSVNAALVADEVSVAPSGSSTTADIEANPSGTPIGTVTLTTPIAPLADALGATNGTFTGKVYVVTTGASSGPGSATQPELELWYAPGVYQIGSFPSTLSFPLTLSFGLVAVPGFSTPQPLPMSSLELTFPAATSPVKSSSCTSVGTVGGTATDEIANLALLFGDTSDGLTSQTGTATAVNLSATPTAVTDQCVATVTKKKVKNRATGSMGGLKTGHPTLTLRIRTGTAFGTVRVGLPRGLSFVKSKRLAKEISASSGKVRAARIAHGKLVIALRHRVKSTTIKTRRGAMAETAALIKSIKRHKTKKLRVSVRAGSASMTATIKA
jgi:hypothetical protein